MSDHPAVEAVARYLAREYWGNQESEGDHTTEAREIVQIVETAHREVPEVCRIARVWAVGDWEPEDRPNVRDADGDVWDFDGEGWSHVAGERIRWSHLLRVWGPVTEVWTP